MFTPQSPTGFTPVDAVLVLTGSIWAGHLHAFFWKNGVYAVIILLGVFAAAMRSAPRGSWGPAAITVLTSLGVVFVFGSSPVNLIHAKSITQEANAALIDGTETPPPQSSVGLPMGFLLVNHAMHDMAKFMIRLVKSDFATNPFAGLAVVNRIAAEKFDRDPALQQRLNHFIDTCYGGALQALQNNPPGWEDAPPPSLSGVPKGTVDLLEVDTPASRPLRERYYPKLVFPDRDGVLRRCDQHWDALNGDLLKYVRTYSTEPATWLGSLSTSIKNAFLTEDRLVRNALRNYRTVHDPAGGAQLSPTSNSWLGAAASWVLGTVAGFINPLVMAQVVDFFQRTAYIVYGYTQMVVYAMFPLVLALSLLPNQLPRLATYFMVLFSLKLWPVVWAMIAAAHERVLQVSMAAGVTENPSGFRYPALLQFVTALMILGAPGLLSLVFGVATHRIGSQMSAWKPMGLPLPGIGVLGGGGRAGGGKT